MNLWTTIAVPLGLGLLGFVEPCTVGSSLLFVKYLEGRDATAKLVDTAAFALTRALLIGALGAVAALVGEEFLHIQRWFWVLLGALYMMLGLLYLAKQQWRLMRAFGPGLRRGRGARGSATLGVLFGLNIPACALPILGALMAASVGAASIARGFVAMAVFGLGLSLPLLVVVFWAPARRQLDRVAAMSEHLPLWTGIVLIALGAWSVYFGLEP